MFWGGGEAADNATGAWYPPDLGDPDIHKCKDVHSFFEHVLSFNCTASLALWED